MGPRPRRAHRDEIGRLKNVTLVESDYSLEWMTEGGADLAESCAWLVGLVNTHRVDIVHVNGYADDGLDVAPPVLVVAHSDVLPWWQAVRTQTAPPEWDDYRGRVVAGLFAATRVIAPTAAALQDLERRHVPLTGKAEVIANGVNFGAFPALPKRPVVLAAGRLWDEGKNFAGLDAIATGLTWPTEIAGDAENTDGGIPDFSNVRLLGELSPPQMARHLASASIFAAPARYEPIGRALLEAAAAGCGLVLGDIPSSRESWDGVAVFVPPEDRLALATLLERA